MKKNNLLIILLAFLSLSVSSQSYIGYLSDNYSGVHDVISNPANIADSRFKTDINLLGASVFVGNDYAAIDFYGIFANDFDNDDDYSILSPKDENNFFANIDVLGPSLMFNINDKSAAALFTRFRSNTNFLGVSGELFEKINNDFGDNTDFMIDNNNFNFNGNSWLEVGGTYAQEIMSKAQHYLKGGLSLKYLLGIVNVYSNSTNVSLNFDADGTTPTDGSVTTTGTISYGNSSLEEDSNGDPVIKPGSGLGVDLGLVYEWRPDYNGSPSVDKNLNKYKLKLGFAITDLGRITYKEGVEKEYDLNGTISESEFDSADDSDDLLNTFYNETSSSTTTKVLLPAAVHLDGDYNFKHYLYLNLSTTLSLISKNKVNGSTVRNRISLTPRFERKWFSFYSPISIYEYSGFQWGVGLRAGPLYLGSGSILSNLISDKSKAADVYAGLKIPIYQNTHKDRDDDGVLDKVDKCKNEAGPAENDGCPWPDKDGDTVLDKDDKCPDKKGDVANNGCPWGDKDDDTVLDNVDGCPDEAGKVENNGCPEKDTDGDTILDKNDECPNEAGTLANKGCPEKDSDGDTVIDKDDNCPQVKGTVANKGCPEVQAPVVSTEVQQTLNAYAKTILFNTGKSSIKSESYKVLTDIVAILSDYPNARFSIEGHTDSVGNADSNQRLSDSRANSVMTYLIKNGIDGLRLRAVGFGESYPISDNETKDGRALNRRVEINLIK